MCLPLGEDEPTVDLDIELPAVTFDEFGRRARLPLDRGRETRGPGLVASADAVADANRHACRLAARQSFAQVFAPSWDARSFPRLFFALASFAIRLTSAASPLSAAFFRATASSTWSLWI